MKKTKILLISLIMLSFIFLSCSKDSTGPGNAKPGIPSNPNPQDNANDVSVTSIISWECSDPEGDSLTYGVYFGISSNPPLVNSSQSETSYDPGTLNEETTYYWKILAHDDHSNSTMGDVWQFTTMSGGTGTITDIDGNVYQTVIIGNQEWMSENLKVTHYRNGDPIPHLTDNTDWISTNDGAYCVYDNITSNSNTYGYLYNWFAIDTDNLAPEGWHIPSEEEWLELIGNIEGGSHIVGGKIKSTGTIEEGNGLWYSPNTGATNESGLTAFPSGYRSGSTHSFPLGYYGWIGSRCYFWSSNSNNSDGLYLYLKHDNSEITSSYSDKNNGISIRCVKDN
ncbi:MAG: fibrobacter succinogenes major paralogous domain-containing protein [Candidatus Tenebribacter davisii]|nr:fibrobacter succinogenes major paralogous domain-containing protein [Candidatus Tenebribacter davisii]